MIRRTKRMAQRTGILGILAILAFSLATETAVGETALLTPKILSVIVDSQGNFLVLNGRDFGVETPAIRLGEQMLQVKSSSANRVVADLPSNLRPATYRLTVSARDKADLADHFAVTIPEFSHRLHSRGSGRFVHNIEVNR